ncbi:5-dehydro-2-deoxygluconokinase [Limimaricola soesokkakensis]|uniref:5-dehydro-2-deoxygluconokinase n=1 Tax=Limimaricola soesokkakensis TaxID=1343159 RepID=A0A1X6ZBH0_9RHOB|nr:5-dehydro-2-deoxygluconokinase [Limimaricola soesokkakensis]PSK86416.1 5-dehydro-2-deoxygluconokinase [Limimaricola soesokkakensis]SLN46306.1 5-dehydro-2-deoxygluconokinase [Limimaricola soesokkakensis]
MLDRLKGRRFLVIGRVGMDLTAMPPGTRTREATDMMVSMGGSSANIAAGLVKLGCSASLVTCVSDDAVGWYCEDQLDAYGIERAHVRRVKGEERTSLALVEARVAEHQSVIYRNNAADFAMNVADVEAVDYTRFDAVITTGTVFAAEPSRAAAFRAFELARAAGLPVIFDVDYRPYSWPSPQVASEVLSRAGAMADIIIGNDEEFGFMAGGIERGFAHARALAESSDLVVYKMGPEGAVTFANGEELRTGIFPVDALKPTGAGDSFMAGLISGLAEARPLREAVLRGSACASVVVAKPGCAPAMPDPAELQAFLDTHPGPTQG